MKVLALSALPLVAAAAYAIFNWAANDANAEEQSRADVASHLPPEWSPDLAPFDHEQALRAQAKLLAPQWGVSEDVAFDRLQLEIEAGYVGAELESAAPGRLAGVWLETDGELRLVAWYTGDSDGLGDVEDIAARWPLPVEIRTGAGHSLNDLLAVARDTATNLGGEARIAGHWVDVRTGVIHVDLQPDSPHRDAPEQLRRDLSAAWGAQFAIAVLAEEATDDITYGGSVLTPKCTSGFTVSNFSGTSRLMTAGHCPNSLWHWDGGVSWPVSFVAESWAASTDIQWGTVPGQEIPQFWTGYQFNYVTGTISRSQQVIGATYCHYGKSTGQSCGPLLSKTYAPNWGNACNGSSCSSTWMLVDWPSQGADGDSGGPWFTGGLALGIHKGSPGDKTVYMAINYITYIGVYLLTQ
jgi:hypothetical protein